MRIFGSDRMDACCRSSASRRRSHRPSLDQQGAGTRAEEGRSPQLRHPQEPAEIRRRLNDQRKVIFEQRIELMDAPDISETVADMRREVIEDLVAKHIPERAYAEQWDAAGLKTDVPCSTSTCRSIDWVKEEGIGEDDIRERITEAANAAAPRSRNASARHHALCRTFVVCRRSTISGASTSSTSTTCARSSASAATPSAIRCRNTSRKPSSCSLAAGNNLRQAVTAQLMRVELVQQEQPEPPEMQAHHIDPTPAKTTSPRLRRRKSSSRRKTAIRDDPVDLGQGRPQRSLPLRLGQEVQALPRIAYF
jgi:preprotein translocase subunit SecA